MMNTDLQNLRSDRENERTKTQSQAM